MEYIWNSVNPVWQNMFQVYKNTYRQIVPVLFQSFLKALE